MPFGMNQQQLNSLFLKRGGSDIDIEEDKK